MSNVTAVTLLIGLTLIGVAVILVTGWVTIGETNQQANMELAEESMLQIDSTLEQSSGGNTTISLPNELEGDVAVANDETYELTLNANPKCSTGQRNLSTIRYTENGQSVAYQGGGVWRMTESGARMSSPPEVSYDQGSLSVSFVEISGQITTTDELQATTNTNRQRTHQSNLSRALYTEGTYNSPGPVDSSYLCKPSEVENATLQIQNSQYASAWASWARNNYDDELVQVTPTGSVNAGDTVTVTYQLGDVSESQFNVTDIRASRASDSSPVEVTADVTNTGGLRAEQTVSFDYQGVSESKPVKISGGDTKTVTFEIGAGEIDTGTHTVTVTADNTTTRDLTFESADGVADVSLDADDIPRDAGAQTTPEANLTVRNSGNMTAFERVTLLEDGSATATRSVTVPPNSERNVSFGSVLPTNNVGTHNLTFTGVRATNTETVDPFTVGENGYFSISSASTPVGVDKDETATVDADVANTGAKPLSGDVSIRMTNADTGTLVDEKTVTKTLNGTAAPGGAESTTVSLGATVDTVGNYSYRVETPDETRTGLFYVGTLDGPYLASSIDSLDDRVGPGQEATLEFEIRNDGNEQASQTVWLNNTDTGETIQQKDYTLLPGNKEEDSWTFTTDPSAFDIGSNNITLSTANTSESTDIEVRDSFSVDDGTITVTESVEATITMEGAEMEYNDYLCDDYPPWPVPTDHVDDDFCPGYIEYSFPVEMKLAINPPDGEKYTRTLWEDAPVAGANVNHPWAERAIYRDGYDNPYKEELSLEPGTEVSLYATSYYCDGVSDSGIDHTRTEDDNAYDGWGCSDRGSEWLDISNETNPDNVVIRGDGDRVPDYNAAWGGQLTLDQMLGPSQITERDGDGYLNLDQNEEVFLYELDGANADPGDETTEPTGDYNDAIARFEVTDVTRNVETEPKFRIDSVDRPVSVDSGEKARVDVKINNTGGKSGDTDVRMNFDGGAQTVKKTTDELSTGETDTVSFLLNTDTRSPGDYDFRIDVLGEEAEQSETIQVDQPPTEKFIVTSLPGTSSTDTNGSPETTVNVSNVGDVDGEQTVVLETKNLDTGRSWTQSGSTTMSIDSGDWKETTFDLPTRKGNYSYRVKTENVTSLSLDLFVGESNVYVPNSDSIGIGLNSYDSGSLIERKGDISGMNVELENDGTVGDERHVRLTVTEDGSDTPVFNETVENKQIGDGKLLGEGPAPASVDFDFSPDLSTGFYSYTVTVYDDTPSDSVGDRVTGELYLRSESGNSTSEDSPITVNSGTITVG